MHKLGYYFIRFGVFLFRILPYRAVHVLSDWMAFLMYRVFGYRKQVMLDNLKRAFPERDEAWRKALLPAIYQNLTDVTLESITSGGGDIHTVRRMCSVRNPELVNAYLDRKQSVILSGSHYHCWEVAGKAIPEHLHGATHIVYKPMSNPYADAYFNTLRENTGMHLVSMNDTFAAMRKHAPEGVAFVMLADQSPSSRKNAHWVDFLGQNSASLPGVDVLARKFKMPVLYFHVERLRRGYYEVVFSEIWPNPEIAAEKEITQAYAKHIEAIIRKKPEGWLWSHKRWKITMNHE
ncbi:MAG: lysophospholipid acyltransferase family protein [Chitinophagales bacterium]|nr:lysophospholipid acyltransferase family protein [Chitinophagales bacterium]